MKKGIEKERIRDAVENGNHAADMQQDDACNEIAEDGNSSQIEMMLQDEYHSASSSKKLKSFTTRMTKQRVMPWNMEMTRLLSNKELH